jgi:hypothetical protein
MSRVRLLLAMFVALVGASSLILGPSPTGAHARPILPAFERSSYWNTPLPKRAPVDPDSRAILRFIRRDSGSNFVSLAGTGPTGEWGMPIYRAKRRDPAYHVVNSCAFGAPREFGHVRIPRGARADPTSDAAMTIYDRARGSVYGLWHARYDRDRDSWSACGGTVYYLRSNGLHGRLRRSDEPRNRGHRGIPPPIWAVRVSEIRSGSIPHVLKIAVHSTKCAHVFPMVANECGTRARHAPPEGTRIRIRRSIDLRRFDLSPSARVVARALQRYGAVIGDQSGGGIVLKVENTIAEGKGWRWQGLLEARSLSAIPLRFYQVIRLGHQG